MHVQKLIISMTMISGQSDQINKGNYGGARITAYQRFKGAY